MKIIELKNTESFLDDTSVQRKSQFLSGKKICLAGGGGIAAIELPKLARELRRHGAKVQFYVTENCLKFIGIDSLKWASNDEVVVQATGLAEHICNFDAIVIIPATADLISKIYHGICSDSVTTLAQSALGQSIPLLFCPTMHNSMFSSPIIQENIKGLASLANVYELPTRKEEGKNKIPDPELLALDISHYINKQKNNRNLRAIVTLGASQVMIDPVRCITNISSGELGKETVYALYAFGVDVKAYVGNSKFKIMRRPNLDVYENPKYEDIYSNISSLATKKIDGIFHILAGSDFKAEKIEKRKISSSQNFKLSFEKTKKIIDLENLSDIPYKLACKLTNENKNQGMKKAKDFLIEKKLNAVLWNDSEEAWHNNQGHKAILFKLLENSFQAFELKGKKEIAFQIVFDFLTYKKIKLGVLSDE
ncbi:MAG: hypothetical protein K2X39_08610, partial [Silvanigrellaceae bacterium]|nr:hypothetical protein [Silvanigrellaceae bacterium]